MTVSVHDMNRKMRHTAAGKGQLFTLLQQPSSGIGQPIKLGTRTIQLLKSNYPETGQGNF